MKLKNKKTGEIIEKFPDVFVVNSGEWIRHYDSLTELNAEWEDYEELKDDIWWLDNEGNINHVSREFNNNFAKNREIGNYFKTREEAEKAVEKLKAWKRLKDKGFKFVGRSIRDLTITYSFDNYDESDIPQMNKDLDLLFGGEE